MSVLNATKIKNDRHRSSPYFSVAQKPKNLKLAIIEILRSNSQQHGDFFQVFSEIQNDLHWSTS